MIKKIFFVLFVSFCCLLTYPYFSKKPIAESQENPINALLDQKLQGLYEDPHPSPLSKLWQPALEKWGLTYSIDAIAVLKGEKFVDKEKAEERFAEVYIEYLNKLNSMPGTRPVLAKFPITPKSFFLFAEFKDIQGAFFNAPHLAAIGSFPDNTIHFCVQTPEREENQKRINVKRTEECEFLKPYYKPFVERIVLNHQDIKIPSLQVNPSTYPFVFSVRSFAEMFSPQYHLFPLAVGRVGKNVRDFPSFSFALWGHEKLSFDTAHKMASECGRSFLLYLQNDKLALDWMKNRSTNRLYNDPATIPEPRHLIFRISLWDEGINRQPAPYIAEIRLQDGVFEYFTSDEGQNLVLLYQETFDDAMHFLETGISNEPTEAFRRVYIPPKEDYTRPEDLLTIRLDKELANFHSSAQHAYPIRMWMPEINRAGFTKSFDPFEILTGLQFSDPAEAEKKYVEIFREYQNKLNSIPYIRPFLWEFPLTPNTLHLEVGLRDEKNEPWPSKDISAILPEPKGTLRFLAYTPFETPEPKKRGSFDLYFPPKREVYKSLLSKPLEQVESLSPCFSPFVLRSPIPVEQLEITSLSYTAVASDSDRVVASFLQRCTKQHRLIPILSWYSDDSVRNLVFSFAACGRQKMPLEEARPLAATCAHECLELLKKDTSALAEMKKRSKET